jgi:hypothetical protein
VEAGEVSFGEAPLVWSPLEGDEGDVGESGWFASAWRSEAVKLLPRWRSDGRAGREPPALDRIEPRRRIGCEGGCAGGEAGVSVMAAMEGALVCFVSGAGDSDSEPTVRE